MRFSFVSAVVIGAALLSASSDLRASETRHVVLVTIDGLRHQEVFGGVDPMLLRGEGIEDRTGLERRFWDEDPKRRRRLLMPFLWSTLVEQGILLGSRSEGSSVEIRNEQRVSYPSYAEILTGSPQPAITGNDPVQIPSETVLELVRRSLRLQRKEVAVFTSWNHFPYIVEKNPGTIFVDAAAPPKSMSDPLVTGAMRRVHELERRTLSPWSSVRHNSFTEALAAAYLETHRPRFVFIAFDETDEWAHSGRYDRTTLAIHYVDQTLERLWAVLQSIDGYRDQTTLIVTTDHGRGRGLDDWTSHGSDVPGAEETWLAVIGPDTPALGVASGHEPVYQTQIAATIARLFGLSSSELDPSADPAIELVFK